MVKKTIMITGLNFQPWVSEHYRNSNGKYGRLLILGESHYYEEDDNEDEKDEEISSTEDFNVVVNENRFTSAVVQDFLENKHNIPFYRNIGLLFNPLNKYEVWNQVAFANGIQIALSNPSSQPTNEEIATVKNAFWLLLDNLNPDKILVCSKRMWNYWLPDDSTRGRYIKMITENNKTSTIWEYQLDNNKCNAMGINHPSKYFSYNNWRPIVENFLSNSY